MSQKKAVNHKRAEENLQKIQETIRALANNLPEFISLKDSERRFLFVNKRFEEWVGVEQQDIVGKTVHDLYSAEQAAEFDALDRQVMTDQIVQSREVDIYYPDGNTRSVISTRFPVVLPSGETVGLGTVNIDITELKDAQAALAHKTELVRLLSRTARDANKANSLAEAMQDALADVCAYNGWPIGHAYVRSLEDPNVLVPSDIWYLKDAQRFTTFKKVTEETTFEAGGGLPGRVMASGEPAWIVDVTKDPNFPRAKLAEDIGVKAGFACPVLVGKEVVAVLEFFAPEAVEPDEDLLDSLIQIGFLLGRVAERERSERELRESEAALAEKTYILETVLESLPEGVVAFDKNLKLLVWNKNFLDISGFPSDLAQRDRAFADFMRYDAEREEFGEGELEDIALQQIERAKKFLPHAFERQRPNGQFISVQGGPMPEGGFVSTYTDITERREARAKIEAQRDELDVLNHQKDKFFSIISHDLKGPFSSLLGHSELMASEIGDFDKEAVVKAASYIHVSAQRVFKLLENLLEWSHLQMEGMESDPSPIDIREVIDTNLILFAPVAEEKNIQLTTTGKQALIALADANMINSIVRNLINNAVKFTAEGGTVTIKAGRKGGQAEVEVSDTGVGMSADKMARLFRLDEKTSTVGTNGETGTGLGLQLCKELVEMQGGEIRVESTEGKGSTFSFTLPLHQG